MDTLVLSKWQRLAVMISSMAASVVAAFLIGHEELAMAVTGRVLLAGAFFGMLWGAEMIDGRKKGASYLVKAFLVGNAVLWLSANFVETQVLDLILGAWVIALCFPSVFLKRWGYPDGIQMSKDTYFAFVGLFRLLVAGGILGLLYAIWKMF